MAPFSDAFPIGTIRGQGGNKPSWTAFGMERKDPNAPAR